MPRQIPASALVGRFNTVPLGQSITRSSSGWTPKRSMTGAAFFGVGSEHSVGMPVRRRQFSTGLTSEASRVADQDPSGVAPFVSAGPASGCRRPHDLANFAEPIMKALH